MHDEKIHYKMYKDGKQWAFAAIVTFTFTIVPMTMMTNHAAAASVEEPAVNLQNRAATSSSSAVTLSANTAASSSAASTVNSLMSSTAAKAQSASTSSMAATASARSAATSADRAAATTVSQTPASTTASESGPTSSTASQAAASSQAASSSTGSASQVSPTSQSAANSQAGAGKTITLDLKQAASTPAVSADAIANSLVANGLNDTAAIFSVKDPEYPSSMYVDPDTNHYTFFWATSRNNQTGKTGEYNIVLSTDRSGNGILYVTILDSTNKIKLNSYTINEDDYEYNVRTSKDSWRGIYLGRIYNDHYSGVIRNIYDSSTSYNWSPRFNVNQGGAVPDSTYYTILSFMIPKLVTQTTSYVDDNGNQIAQSHVQQGLSGQTYTTTGGKVVNGYYEIVPSNSSGYMSEFGKIGDTYTKNWHNGDMVVFTQTGADGTMRADYYYNNSLRGSYTLTPSGAGSSVTVESGSGGNITIYNIYIPQTRNVQYVYKKLGNLVIDSTDAAFDAAKKTKTQYANDPDDATSAADVTLPTIAGFVPFINGVAVTDYTFNPAKYITSLDQDITVVYRAKQKARIDFIDQDSGNQVISSSGTLTDFDGQTINFSTADQLKQLVYDAKTNPNGKYDLVKDGFPAGATYDSNANVDQVYQVVLKHHHETVDGKTYPANGQKTVKRTIDYYYQGDGKAAPSVEQSVTFTRTGDRDRVNGTTTWEDWSKVAAQNVEHVDSPKINGYTADKLTVAGITIRATDKDSTETVTYVPNKQAVKVIYHDDTTNQDLAVKEFSGNSGADSGRNTKAAIAEYVKQHLKLVSDSTNGQNIIFDKDDQNDQTYVVHFVHETEAVKRTKTVTETIEHHKAIKQLDGTTKYVDIKNQIPVYTATLTFNESGVHDLYTDQTIWNGDWTPTQTFKTVVSPTLAGYTPDVAQVDAVAITVTDANYDQSLNVHHDIIYVGKSQILVVNYIDDTTHQVLEYWTGTGQSGQTLDYTTAATINKYLGQHYALVSDATNGNQPVLDEDDISNNQVLEVHLKHQTTNTSRTMKVTEEIRYAYKGDANYKDGTLVDQSLLKQANPLTRELVFEQDGVIDNVTGTTTWNNDWKQTKSFKAVTTPNLKGYTVSVDEVPAQSVTIDASTFDQKGKTYSFTVNYTPLKQTALIKYIDGSDNDKVLETDTQTGLSNQKLDYTSIRNQILAKYANYEVASDETENGIVFNDDAGQDQIFKIVLKHKTTAVTHSVEVKQIIHFKFSDNHQQPWDQTSTLTFTQNGVKDQVTGKTDWDSSYSETQYFKEVKAKPIAGYTPDIQTLASRKITVTNDNFVNGQFEGTITYSPNRQYISVSYIDDTTGKQLANEVLNGYSNTIAYSTTEPNKKYSTTELIKNYLGQGYELVSDSTNGAAELKFDATDDPYDQVYAVHLKHGYEDTQRTKTVVEEIKYQYENGKSVQDPYHKELTFTQKGQLDKVTKATDWNGDWSAAQTLAKVDSPKITGYHYDYAGEPEHTITITNDNYDKDLNIYRTVTYYADSQNVAIVYVDTKTNNAIASESLEGKTGDHQTYSAQDFIAKKLTNYQNYTLDKDETQNGIIFPADGQLKVYYVYLGHKTEDVSRTANVKQIIHYQSTDGRKLAEDTIVNKQASQTGTHDLVDDTTAWGEWTQADFDAVQAPMIAGYTDPNPDQIVGESSAVTNDNWQQDNTLEHTILYTPKSQTATITFIDDDAKDPNDRQMSTVTLNGHSNEDSGYNTSSAVASYQQIGYVKVSDGTNGQNVIFDANDAADQSFVVHFKHGKNSTSRPVNYQRVITYIYGNGGKAGQNVFAPETQTLEFTQTGIQDLVNKQVTWDKLAAQSFKEVPSQKIAGYVYDKAVVPASEIRPADSDFAQKTVVINETVTYTAQPQKAKIYFIDGTTPTGHQLLFKELGGLSDMNSGYTTTDMIKGLEQLHYQLLTDETNGQEIVFDHNDEDQVYYVYFGHETEKDSRTKTVTETIDYVKDGAVLSDQRVEKELNFTQNGVKDLVNNIVDWNGTWTPTQKFAAVPSLTIKGYKAVPGQVDEIAITVNNDNYNQDLNVYKQVVYTANPQSAYIEYFDQDTGTIIGEKNLTGFSNQLSDYSTVNVIKAWAAKGYDLVKDETGGQPIRFDDDDNVSQSFVVYLKHRHATVNRSVKVQRVVHYVFRDGPKQGQMAASDYHDPAADLTFEQTGDEDLVTHTIVYDATYKKQAQFGELILTHGADYDAIAELIPGYHLNVNTLSPKTVVIDADTFAKASDGVFMVADTVYYIIDNQLANINYVDDDLDEKVVTIDQTTGQSGAKSNYDSAKTLARLIYNEQTNPTGQYDLVSDGTKDGIVFDLDDQVDQTFVVHLKHHILKQAANREKTIKQTVLYKYADGTQAADPYSGKDMTFKQTGDLDMVTGAIDWNGAWTTDERQGKFDDVTSPTIKGYTPDVTVLSHSPLTMDNDKYDAPIDLLDIVTYSPNDQTAIIKYVDIDNGGSFVAYDEAKGKTNEQINYDTKDQLSKLVYDEQTNPTGKYVLVSDGFTQALAAAQAQGQQLRFDNDDQNYQLFTIYLRHHYSSVDPDTDPASGIRKVSQIIHYVYQDSQQPAANDNVQVLTFKRVGYQDDVTGKVYWPLWETVASQKTVAVASPTIKGYTPVNGQTEIGANEIAAAQKDDVVIYVNYAADPQQARINYVDQDTGQTIQSDKVDGVTDAKIDYSTADQIKQLINKGYVLVSDGFTQALAAAQAQGQQLRFDNDDQNYQLFTIYLRHHYSSVDPDTDPASGIRKVSQIIHYVYQDSQQPAANDNVQVLTFKRVGYQDDVTGKVYWPLWETVASQKTVAVASPTIKGYTPVNGQTEIGANEIAAAQKDDVVIYVNYAADPQQARINYVDQDTGQTIQSDKVDGVTDAKIDYSTADQIKQLINKGYVLVSDEFTQAQDAGKAVFDRDGNALQTFTVTLKHGTQVIDPNHPDPDNPILPETPINPADPTGPVWPAKDQYDHTTRAIVHYQDASGNSLVPDSIQTARLTRTITVDKVTGKIIAATDWTSDPAEYAAVSSPVIDGYTPDQTMVSFEMTPADQVKTVLYAKNAVPVEPEQPTEPSQPAAPSETVQPSIGRDSQSMQTSAESPTAKTTMKQLPQTGNDNDNDASWSIMGLLTSLLGMLGLAGLFKKKHDRG
ncbi:mucin-binding protein [Limosilactobacillus mucosae]|uniref:mucin-binding protein n=1 Tax=Limosilactobacillus mucosae TaxID=97478 RepID=UPI0013E8B505|nr:KxYKxGKxW signal peptide domain-containing protein [Limosilactobacillus mucosae]